MSRDRESHDAPEHAPRVLLSGVCLGQPMGGVHRRAAEILPRAGRLLFEAGGGLSIMEGRHGLSFELPKVVERLPSRVPASPPIARALREERALVQLIDAARKKDRPFHLVHTAHFPVPRRLPLPFTLTIHDLRSLTLEHTPFSRRLFARHVLGGAIRRAACTIVVSRTVQAELTERFAAQELACIPNAADHLPVLPRLPPRPPRPIGRAIDAEQARPLVAVGHIEPRKNLGLLLEVLAIDIELPPLWLIGAERKGEGKRLRMEARRLGVAERVSFKGSVDDQRLAEIYAQAACVVFPSHLEGFGIPALEALQAGAPLAISTAGALPEVAGEDVPHFPPDEAAACARAIRAALTTPEAVLESRRERARGFGWEKSARDLVGVWTRIAARARNS